MEQYAGTVDTQPANFTEFAEVAFLATPSCLMKLGIASEPTTNDSPDYRNTGFQTTALGATNSHVYVSG